MSNLHDIKSKDSSEYNDLHDSLLKRSDERKTQRMSERASKLRKRITSMIINGEPLGKYKKYADILKIGPKDKKRLMDTNKKNRLKKKEDAIERKEKS